MRRYSPPRRRRTAPVRGARSALLPAHEIRRRRTGKWRPTDVWANGGGTIGVGVEPSSARSGVGCGASSSFVPPSGAARRTAQGRAGRRTTAHSGRADANSRADTAVSEGGRVGRRAGVRALRGGGGPYGDDRDGVSRADRETSSARAVRRNLAVGPPSIEQSYYALSLAPGRPEQPPLPVVAVSRPVDAPRRMLSWFRDSTPGTSRTSQGLRSLRACGPPPRSRESCRRPAPAPVRPVPDASGRPPPRRARPGRGRRRSGRSRCGSGGSG